MERKKYSKKREAIYEAIKNTKTHPTAEWVYETLRPKYPDISLGTVYRNIGVFKESGLIRSVGSVGGFEHFDADTSDHAHFICEKCGRIFDMEYSGFPVRDEIESYGHTVCSVSVMFYGNCRDCS